MMMSRTTESILSAFVTLSILSSTVQALGCFVCTSINNSNPDCEDTFNNTGKFYQTICWASRKGRYGLFPATECIKMTAQDGDKSYIVRSCVVDNGGTNSESEIGRQSHCGWMKVIQFEKKRMDGCIMSCKKDGCNTGQGQMFQTVTLVLPILTFLWIYG